MVADTLANVDKTLFYKFNVNEMYPDHVLIYRDLVRNSEINLHNLLQCCPTM